MEAVRTMRDPASEVSPAELIRAHQAALWRYLRFLGAEEGLAADLVQETFLAVLRKPFEQRGERATRAYLRTVARNLFLMHVRRRRARPALVDLEAADAEWARHDGDDGEDYRRALRECLKLLGERARRAIDLFYRERRSREAIARDLGMAADGVKTLMRRSRHALRECIEKKVAS